MGRNAAAAPDVLSVSDPSEQQDLAVLQRSGLFEGEWFTARNTDVPGGSHAVLVHWHRYGWQEGRWPNPYFDPTYYRSRNPDCTGNPLLHYIQQGEAAGRRPVAHFDPAWYRTHHAVPVNELCLAHYLRQRCTPLVSPLAEFDAAFYLRENPDVAAAGMDPMEHYLVRGASEGRMPCPRFNPKRWGGAGLHPNPLLGLLRWREEGGLDTGAPNIADEVRRNTRPAAGFEAVQALPPGLPRRAMLLAYYLPQFHPVAENDAWWGKGFTEWTSLGRALPRFAGHYQPRIPRDLGHYRLDGSDTLRRQAELARGAGLHGFVFYFYWFNGRRLLEAPLEALLADRGIDLPFCLMWANENWSRRWDGSDHEVLISQDYRTRDEPALIAEFARHFADPRYIRLGGRPVLMVYRAQLIPDTAATVDRWRRLFRTAHGEDPLFIMAQSFGAHDPRPAGMDAAVEFPPHKLTSRTPMITDTLHVLDPAFDAEVYDYAAIARASVEEPQPDYPLIKTAAPGWDNDPRRQGAGTVLHGADPALYQAWLENLIGFARRNPIEGEAVVCINAWNEWAEGATLEPDVHWGGAFLNATGRAAAGLPAPGVRTRILLVGHDGLVHGAQTLLLRLGRALRANHGVDVAFLLLAGGPLEAECRAVAPTVVAGGPDQLDALVRSARAAGCTAAIVNTAASAGMAAVLERHQIPFVLLVHELPRLLREKGLIGALREGMARARTVVFPAELVRDRCLQALGTAAAHTAILPQGVEAKLSALGARQAVRAELHVPQNGILALGMGYADLRKGFDLFLHVWRAMRDDGAPVSFAWAGGIDPATESHFGAEIAAAEATGSFRFLGQRDDPADLLAAADVFLLTSREDPLPSVVLEAMANGTPVVAFEETGGAPELLARFEAGRSVPLGDVTAMARAAAALAAGFGPERKHALAAASRAAFRFEGYSAALLKLARPGLLSVSVVVPSCDYGRYMPSRLASILAQSYPVREVIVLDDASTDDSVAAARQTAQAWGRRVEVEEGTRRSGSVFRQWRRAAERASGDWLWIAEADDEADPAFLAAVAEAAGRAPDAAFAFSDSCAIDGAGTLLWPDHKGYYGPAVLASDAVFSGPAFLREHLAERNLILNVSGVLWRRADLLAALRRCEADLAHFRVAGDWRVYAEVLARPGAQVAYVSRPLNRHRRHGASVTARLGAAAHVAEVARVHEVVSQLVGPDPALRQRQRRYRRSLVKGSA